MIEDPKRLTIKRPSRRPTDEQIAAFQDAPTGFVADAMHGAASLDKSIAPLAPGVLPDHCAGPALTVDNGPGDILATLAALNFVQKGDVAVVGFSNHQGSAVAGDRLVGMMRNCGAVGFVTDGPMRDYDGLVGVGLPCWCTGLTPDTPYATGPGKIGLPVVLGGRQVETGDMIVADRDGVVVVPFDRLDEVIGKLDQVRTLELALDAEVAAGLTLQDSVKEMIQGDDVAYV